MNIICTICARGGSKGVTGKNLQDICGRPLIAHSISQAWESGVFEHVVVSSDSEAILQTAHSWGADILVRRPAELATDVAPKLPAIEHALLQAEIQSRQQFDIVVDLDATSPLRNSNDIRGAIQLLKESGASQVISGAASRRSPYFNLVELTHYGTVSIAKQATTPIVRRQDSPKCFDLNGSVYVWTRSGLLNRTFPFNADARLYVMDEDRSFDIDSELDLLIVRYLMHRRRAHTAATP